MKRKLIPLILALSLLLCGCAGRTGSADWAGDWTVIAPFLASEGTEGFLFGESADTLGLGGVYYATWSNGDKRDFTNAEGESTVFFNAQIYVVAQEGRTEADAEQNIAAWIAREQQNYSCGEPYEVTCNGQTYTVLFMSEGKEGNPYPFGCAAFTRFGTNAVCVELVCSDTFTGGPDYVLEAFLNGLHYHE